MSRQAHLYLLPADVNSLVEVLKARVGISLIQPSSLRAEVTPLDSAVSNESMQLGMGAVCIDCYIVQPNGAGVKLHFLPGVSKWQVDIESEVIEFSGCEFNGTVLLRGRLYFQKDFVVDDTLVSKRKEFLHWADNVFRVAKKSLHRSKAIDAYLGDAAAKWEREGGRLAWTATPERGPIYELGTNSR